MIVKRLLITILLVGFLTGCNLSSFTPDGNPDKEIFIKPLSKLSTKGYVESTSMIETTPTTLHGFASKSQRSIWLTAWHYPQHGEDGEYFRNYQFDYNAGGNSDGYWHKSEAVYWPLGGTLDFMAYSCTNPFPESAVTWSPGISTDRLSLTVDQTYTQDDILFSSCSSRTANDGDSVSMTFEHAQAWVQFVFHCSDASMDNVVSVKKMVIEDIYTTGTLTVSHPYGTPEAKWSFRYDTRFDTVVDDNNGVYTLKVTTSNSYLDMLIPEQKMKPFMLYYKLEGGEPVMQYEYILPNATWQMGKKYIYDITFSPNHITVDMSVTNFNDGGTTPIPIPD